MEDSSLPTRTAKPCFTTSKTTKNGSKEIDVSLDFVLCCQFLWIVHFWLPLRYSLMLIYAIITGHIIMPQFTQFTRYNIVTNLDSSVVLYEYINTDTTMGKHIYCQKWCLTSILLLMIKDKYTWWLKPGMKRNVYTEIKIINIYRTESIW